MNKCIIFTLVGIVGLGCFVGADVLDCRDKLEVAIKGVPIPTELSNAAEDLLKKGLGGGRMPGIFQHDFDAIAYLRQLSEDDRKRIVEVSSDYRSAANAMLRALDCDHSDVYQLIDINNAEYENLVEPLAALDSFNGYYELSDSIIHGDLSARSRNL